MPKWYRGLVARSGSNRTSRKTFKECPEQQDRASGRR
jgi:hypothetical protein